ncbi:MAG: hypothetical protein WCI74_05230, partial [Actinomycetes bacterium]
DYWRSGRASVAGSVCGSQMLWNVGRSAGLPEGYRRQNSGSGVVFLGQLHGLELPRRVTRQSVSSLRRASPVYYRPHPGETDRASRVQHRLWQSQGVKLVEGGAMSTLRYPVLAHFSTGILEAAAAGVPSYGYCAQPPAWLLELWNRYQIAQWGETEPTHVCLTTAEPAAAIADVVEAEI